MREYQELRLIRILRIIRDNKEENIVKLSYRIVNDLLYFDNDKRGLRLYILEIMKVEVFKLAYNEIRYPSYARTYKKLTKDLYIFNITSKLYKFIRHYSYYQLN